MNVPNVNIDEAQGKNSEGVKKLEVCASVRKDGCLVEVLECGSFHVMGNHPLQ